MTTYTVEPTGRTWAGTSYNRTTRRWRDGGPDLAVEIHDDDSGQPLTSLSDDELLAVAGFVADAERNDVGEIADAVADEVTRRLDEMGAAIASWDGESASKLATMLNDVEAFAKEANDALSYVPGRPFGYDFTNPVYDSSVFGWHSDVEPPMSATDVYAVDKHGNFLICVAGTTDDGWTSSSAAEYLGESE